MNQTKPTNINKLPLDIDNPRFPTSTENQREAIAKCWSYSTTASMVWLKISQLKVWIPQKTYLYIPVKMKMSFFVVAEGNLRVTALKLLLSPKLAQVKKHKKPLKKLRLHSLKI